MQTQRPQFQTLTRTAAELGVPRAFLKREAEAGRLPALRIGRRWRFDIEVVREALAERAQQPDQREVRHG